MRVLVTGSAGHLGTPLIQALLCGNTEVRSFDRLAQDTGGAWEHVPGDIRDIQAVRKAVQGVDVVLHLAAIAGDRRGYDDEVLTVNVAGTWNILLACTEAGVGRTVCLSSVNALGNFRGHCKTEYLPVDDAYPRHPISPYQLSKHLAEETCRAFSRAHGLVTICLRPVLITTSDQYSRWRANQTGQREEWLRGDYWSYVDIDDVVTAILLSMYVEGISHDAFLLSAEDTAMREPTEDLLDRHYPGTPWRRHTREGWFAGNPRRSIVDCSHAADVLGWHASRSWMEA